MEEDDVSAAAGKRQLFMVKWGIWVDSYFQLDESLSTKWVVVQYFLGTVQIFVMQEIILMESRADGLS